MRFTTGRTGPDRSQVEAAPLSARELNRFQRWQEGAEALTEEIVAWRSRRHRMKPTPSGVCSECLLGPDAILTQVRPSGQRLTVHLHTNRQPTQKETHE